MAARRPAGKSSSRAPAPPQALARLAQELAEGAPARAYLFRGEEGYFQEAGLRQVAEAATRAGWELCSHDADDPEFRLAALLDDLSGAPLFATGRAVVVRRADALFAKVEGADAPLTRSAKAFLAAPAPPGTLAVSARSLRADHAFAKALKAAGGALVDCRKLWPSPPPWRSGDPREAELVQWLVARAAKRKVQLSADDALYVVAATGNDLAALDTELEKLAHAGPGKRVRESVSWSAGGTPWETADELLAGDLPRALSAVEALFRSGMADGRRGKRETDAAALTAILIGSLRSRARQAWIGAVAFAEGADTAQAARRAGAAGAPQAVAAFERRARSRSAEEWRRACELVAAVERRSKSSGGVDANDFALLATRLARRTEGSQRRG